MEDHLESLFSYSAGLQLIILIVMSEKSVPLERGLPGELYRHYIHFDVKLCLDGVHV